MLFLLAIICCTPQSHCLAGDSHPTKKELEQAHQQLQKDSQSVQGKFWVYRVEKVHPDIFDKHPTELGMPLIREGYLWRSKDRFRADFNSSRLTIGGDPDYSLAKDNQRVFEFSTAPGDVVDSLLIYDLNTEEAKAPLSFIDSSFLHPLDSLWSSSGVPYTDMLQESGSKIIQDSSHPDGKKLSLLIPTHDANPLEVILASNSPHPIIRVVAKPKKGMRFERRIDFVTVDGQTLPSRITDLSSMPGSEYTKVVLFELEPLAEHSPIDTDFEFHSFKDMSGNYFVNYTKEPDGWLTQKSNLIQSKLTAISKSPGGFQAYLPWIGIFITCIFFVWFVFIRKKE
ncbi:MAG: hypothetical protein JKY95_08015 [Planctomycetaceae bacterium]|nr:hypothetical protein [Planctomycetaceae bacterium]